MKFIIPKNSLKTIQFVPSDENENHDGLGRTIMSEKEKNKTLTDRKHVRRRVGSTSAEGCPSDLPFPFTTHAIVKIAKITEKQKNRNQMGMSPNS